MWPSVNAQFILRKPKNPSLPKINSEEDKGSRVVELNLNPFDDKDILEGGAKMFRS